jgi:DNA-binding response OmpR family regulator
MASVLVVDDEEDIRELVRINLELDGHTVAVAGNGAEALDQLRQGVPEIVLLDVMMPGMDGWELLSRMKAERAEVAGVPVLMLTARSDDMDRIRGGIEGAIRYITKPFSLTELRDEVRAALTGDPEPVQRRRAQTQALERLARLERGDHTSGDAGQARPRLTKLEGAPEAKSPPARLPRIAEAQVAALSTKQRELLDAVASTSTVRAAAEQLHVSRSNVYASLRRIARKLDVASVPELVALARQGGFPTPPPS